MTQSAEDRNCAAPGWKPVVIASVAIVMSALAMLHVRGVNGPAYWVWPWRRLDLRFLIPGLLIASAPIFVGQTLLGASSRRAIALMLLLAMISWISSSIVATCCQLNPPSLRALYLTVTDQNANGYFGDAGNFVMHRDRGDIDLHTLVRDFPQYMPLMSMHARIRPPGNTLFYVPFHDLFADQWKAAIASAMTLGLLASLSIPATYLLVRELGGSSSAALAAACFLALSPGFINFFSAVDTVYPTATVLLTVTWLRALRRKRIAYAVAFGAILAGACFFAFNFLVLGPILGALTFLQLRSRATEWKWAGKCIAGATGIFFLFWILLWLFSGFDILQVFKTALRNQRLFAVVLNRPFPGSIPWDLYDFALAGGWISFILLLMGWKNWRQSKLAAVALICIAQPCLVGALGLLQTETARVWLFMQPLILVPIGLELANWSRRQRLVVYASLLLATFAITQNMWLLGWSEAVYK
jgi:hypothetical protein